jgi:hypothetical protein
MRSETDRVRAPICVERIEHPRGDGLGRALVVDCLGGALVILLDDAAEVCDLIGDLTRGLAWMTERSRDVAGAACLSAPADPAADSVATSESPETHSARFESPIAPPGRADKPPFGL